MTERDWLEYRLDVISSWPESKRKAIVRASILSRLETIGALKAEVRN